MWVQRWRVPLGFLCGALFILLARPEPRTLAAGGAVALVTQGPTPYDRLAAVKLDGDVVDELEAVLAAL